VRNTWIIGGVGNWDYMTMDPVANELFIAHGPAVQVVDVAAGTVVGTIRGLREAHAIVLDPGGTFGYISDGPAAMVRIFDRRSFQVLASVPTGASPRSMALDPASGLLFVVGSNPGTDEVQGQSETRLPARRQTPRPGSRRETTGMPTSTLTVIDPAARVALAEILLAGHLGFAQTDGNGRVYITVVDRNQILRIDAQAVGGSVRRLIDSETKTKGRESKGPEKPLLLDWTPNAATRPPADAYPTAFSLGANCEEPRALAFDSAHARLFAACSNFRMVVLDAATGRGVAAVPIGPGADAIGYDANRGLIYTANGGGDGSLTIIRQDVTDSYSVIQTLPTRQHARTLAVDSANGNVYLTSVIYGAELSSHPVSGGNLNVRPIDSSFQVLVVGSS
jgi:DNA-binding beta-propeller fold protein YncE